MPGQVWPPEDDALTAWLREQYVAYRLDRPFGGRVLGRAEPIPGRNVIWVHRTCEAGFLSRLKS